MVEQPHKYVRVKDPDIFKKFVEILNKYPAKVKISRVILLISLLEELGLDISHCITRTKTES